LTLSTSSPDEDNVVSFIFEWIAGKDNPGEELEGSGLMIELLSAELDVELM
jgi:hypothetical protein